MRYGSVCSGIEAATMAWHSLGWSPSFFSEIEAFPCAVLQHHYPDVPLHGDFTTIEDGDYEPVDLVVGGTPCQSFSNAGLRAGLDDPRGNLMLGYGALAAKLRPQWLVWENVPGVLSSNGGRDFGTFLRMLAKLGYGFAYRVLDAQYFGLAQRRRRVFVVGYLGDWRPPAAVLFERHSLSGDPAPGREAREDVTGTLNARTSGGGGLGTDFECMGGLQPVAQGFRMAAFGDYLEDGTASNIKARDYKDATGLVVQGPLTMAHGQGGTEIGYDRGPKLTCNHKSPIVCHGTQDPLASDKAFPLGRNNGAENAVCFTGEVTHALDTCNNGKGSSEDDTGRGVPTVSVSLRGRDGGGTAELGDSVAGTVRASSGGGDKPHVLSGMAVRRLTPRECERLQGFPDDFTKVHYRGKPAKQCPDGPRYKALGNSMAVPCMSWIGERIQRVSEIVDKGEEAA